MSGGLRAITTYMQILLWRTPTLVNNICLFASTVSASPSGSQRCSEQDWIMQETLSHTTNSSRELQVERQENSLTHLKTTIAVLHGGQASRKICGGRENEWLKRLERLPRCGCRKGTDCLNEFYEYNKEVGALTEEVFAGTNKETILWSPDENQVDARTISKECESIKTAVCYRPVCVLPPDFKLGCRLKPSSTDYSWDSREGK